MTSLQARLDYGVTPEKVDEAVRRIVEYAHPLQIIVFGSRARGDHREESDLDLAVILDDEGSEVARDRVPYTLLAGLDMPVDLVPVKRSKYELHRPWQNSVYNDIDQEGIILYDRENPGRASARYALWRRATLKHCSIRCPILCSVSMPSRLLRNL